VDLLSACDIRMASADALFSIRETRIAIIADLGTLQRLPHIIGQGWFRELALTGRDFTADEALRMGFVTRICDDREALIEAAGDLAAEIAGLAPLTVQGVKEVINFQPGQRRLSRPGLRGPEKRRQPAFRGSGGSRHGFHGKA
jgi:enoyl-CoA hydratase/carnithine racemase